MSDLEQHANIIVEQLIRIKDIHRREFTRREIDTLNDACNLIYHNIKELKRELNTCK